MLRTFLDEAVRDGSEFAPARAQVHARRQQHGHGVLVSTFLVWQVDASVAQRAKAKLRDLMGEDGPLVGSSPPRARSAAPAGAARPARRSKL
jgi:hypothetical protein